MVKALRVLMYIYGAILILVGLSLLFLPEQMAAMYGTSNISSFAKFTAAGLGSIYLAAGVWIAAAGRDPLRDIRWVKSVITKGALSIVAGAYTIVMGYVKFNPFG